MSHMVQMLGFLVFTQVPGSTPGMGIGHLLVQFGLSKIWKKRHSIVSQKYAKIQQLTCPIWSSGQDSWFSPRWPGFNSRYGNRTFISIAQFVKNILKTTQYSILKICKKTAINMSHMVQRLGFLVLTQVARVRLPVWEQDIYQYSLVCRKYAKYHIVQYLKNMQKYNN